MLTPIAVVHLQLLFDFLLDILGSSHNLLLEVLDRTFGTFDRLLIHQDPANLGGSHEEQTKVHGCEAVNHEHECLISKKLRIVER
jgi:hypothetical protein